MDYEELRTSLKRTSKPYPISMSEIERDIVLFYLQEWRKSYGRIQGIHIAKEYFDPFSRVGLRFPLFRIPYEIDVNQLLANLQEDFGFSFGAKEEVYWVSYPQTQ